MSFIFQGFFIFKFGIINVRKVFGFKLGLVIFGENSR